MTTRLARRVLTALLTLSVSGALMGPCQYILCDSNQAGYCN